MKVRCAWHKENFGFVLFLPDKPPFDDHGVTDTICPECYNIVMKESQREKSEIHGGSNERHH